jgi:hypothetical protein
MDTDLRALERAVAAEPNDRAANERLRSALSRVGRDPIAAFASVLAQLVERKLPASPDDPMRLVWHACQIEVGCTAPPIATMTVEMRHEVDPYSSLAYHRVRPTPFTTEMNLDLEHGRVEETRRYLTCERCAVRFRGRFVFPRGLGRRDTVVDVASDGPRLETPQRFDGAWVTRCEITVFGRTPTPRVGDPWPADPGPGFHPGPTLSLGPESSRERSRRRTYENVRRPPPRRLS